MGKKKKSQVGRTKKSEKEGKKNNPFEIRINREHHDVLGRKKKSEKGKPGISRAKANEKRKETLLIEYRNKSKSNSFVDKRIGESDPSLSLEDKAIARFAKERKKKTLYDLNDAEELTHFGQSIGDMDKFDAPYNDDSEEEMGLDGDLVKKAHFGGFLTKKSEEENARSHKEIMEDVIAESKKRKYERKMEKDANEDLTEKLDNDWKELQKLMGAMKGKGKAEELKEKEETEIDYDIKVQELKFESKGRATNRLKTEEEIALEDKEKLEKMEAQRKARMMGVEPGIKKNHYSADGLDDDFKIDEEDEPESFEDKRSKNFKNSMDGEENEDDSDWEDIGEDQSNDKEGSDKDIQDDGGWESEDSYADVLSGDENDNKETEPAKEKKKVHFAESVLKIPAKKADIEPLGPLTDLPFVFEFPSSMDNFYSLVANRTAEEVSIILERIIKCHHPSLSEQNKDKMEKLFVILLQYIDDLCSENSQAPLTHLDSIISSMGHLVRMCGNASAQYLTEVLTEKRDDYQKNKKMIPPLSTLIFFQLVSLFYPTSDFRHPVVTPAMILMSEILTKTSLNSLRDILGGLFLCTQFYEYVNYSKRLVPEVITFLNKILWHAVDNDKSKRGEKLMVYPEEVFTPKDPETKTEERRIEKLKLILLKESCLPDHELISKVLHHTIELTSKFSNLYKETASFSELFSKTKSLLGKLSLKSHNRVLMEDLSRLIEELNKVVVKVFLQEEKKKPPTLKLYEPKIQDRFDGRKERSGNAQKLERQKLIHKHKREMKGAVREIRRDNQFLAREKLKEQIERDAERKRKLNLLYNDLAQQEGDFKKMSKKKF